MYPENAWDAGAVLQATMDVCEGCRNLATRAFAGTATPGAELEKKLKDNVAWATTNRPLLIQTIQDIKDIGRLSDKMMQPENVAKIGIERIHIMQERIKTEKGLEIAREYIFKVDYWVWLVRRCLDSYNKIKMYIRKDNPDASLIPMGLFNNTYDWYLQQALNVYTSNSQKFGPPRPRKPLPPAPVIPTPARPATAAPMGAPIRIAPPPVIIPVDVTTEQVLSLW